MTAPAHPYDRELFDRSFLNCSQRQALVMLAERGVDVTPLFRRCLVGTDDILEQIVREQRARHDFTCRFFADDDLAAIGVRRRETVVETFALARDEVLDAVRREGFAQVAVDVFYLPHCAEHRTTHLPHTIVLTGRDPDDGTWSVVDDNAASVLCHYRYPESLIAAAYDNGPLRRVKTYSRTGPPSAGPGDPADVLRDHRDSGALLDGAAEILDSPWIAPARAAATLFDAFALHRGSRNCLLAWVDATHGPGDARDALADAVTRGTALQNRMLLARATGVVDAAAVAADCAGLARTERRLVAALRAAVDRVATTGGSG